MPERTLISVVLAAYNGEKFIAGQLDSIVAQTYRNIEIICVDDASTDNTAAIIEEYQQRHPDMVRYYRNTVNAGSRKAFESGCGHAKGVYIAFADQDDWWMPEKLDVLNDAMNANPGLAFVYSNSELVDENLNIICAKTWDEHAAILGGSNFYRVLATSTIMGCSMLVDALFAKQCMPFPAAGLHHDRYLATMALGMDRPILFVNRVLFKYRRHAGNQVNRGKTPRSQRNTTRHRAIRSYKEAALLDIAKFTNAPFREMVVCKMGLFQCMLRHCPVRALYYWRKLYALLEKHGAADKRVKYSNLRYIFYSLFWKRATDRELE